MIRPTLWRRIREVDWFPSLEDGLTLVLIVKRALHSGVHPLLSRFRMDSARITAKDLLHLKSLSLQDVCDLIQITVDVFMPLSPCNAI